MTKHTMIKASRDNDKCPRELDRAVFQEVNLENHAAHQL